MILFPLVIFRMVANCLRNFRVKLLLKSLSELLDRADQFLNTELGSVNVAVHYDVLKHGVLDILFQCSLY